MEYLVFINVLSYGLLILLNDIMGIAPNIRLHAKSSLMSVLNGAAVLLFASCL